MKNVTPPYIITATKIIMLVCACLMLLLSCAGKEDGAGLESLSSEELIRQGWNLFKSRNYYESELYFSELSTRADSSLVGYYGLGWTYIKLNKYENAKNEFTKFIVLDTLDVFSTTSIEYVDVQAGFSVAYNAIKEHATAITASQRVANTWIFRYDNKIESVDIRLIRADSQYSLSQFSATLTTIRTIDPNFNADPTTVEGQLQIARKLESMIAERR